MSIYIANVLNAKIFVDTFMDAHLRSKSCGVSAKVKSTSSCLGTFIEMWTRMYINVITK